MFGTAGPKWTTAHRRRRCLWGTCLRTTTQRPSLRWGPSGRSCISPSHRLVSQVQLLHCDAIQGQGSPADVRSANQPARQVWWQVRAIEQSCWRTPLQVFVQLAPVAEARVVGTQCYAFVKFESRGAAEHVMQVRQPYCSCIHPSWCLPKYGLLDMQCHHACWPSNSLSLVSAKICSPARVCRIEEDQECTDCEQCMYRRECQ